MPKVSKSLRDQMRTLVQYLNLEEMRRFCRQHDLPMFLHVQRADGRLVRTSDRDRKDVVLLRMVAFAVDGKRLGPTLYRREVVAAGPLPARLTAQTRLHYPQYEKHNPRFVSTMRNLTGGAFRTGMIARLVLRDLWTAGVAPTMQQFAREWLRATAAHDRPRPEGAYLLDLWRGEAGPGWKQKRVRNARKAERLLHQCLRARQ